MQLKTHIQIYITGLLLLLSSIGYSTNYYWVASTLSSWQCSSCWSTTSGGAGGTVVPGSVDVAIFDGNGLANCTMNANVNVAGLNIVNGYTGTISQGANTITIGASNASFAAGTFTGGSSAIIINGSFTLAGTAFTSTSNTLTFNGAITNTSGTFTHNNGTVAYNGTNSQTVSAWNYYNLTISGSYGIKNVTLAGTGTIGIANAFTNTASFSTGVFINTGSTIEYKGTGSQTIIAFNYNNLTSSSTGTRTLASSGTIGIAATFTKGTNTYTITGSTIDYNSTSAQTITAFNYNNLTISGARTTNNITLASSGTIGIAAILSNTATFSSGAYVISGSTINYNGTGAQNIIAFNYNHLTISGTHTTNNVTLANSGTIGVFGTFTNSATFSTGSIVNTGSTIDFNSTGAQTISAFNYNNLTISGTRTSNNITLANTGTIGIAGVFSNTATFSTGVFVITNSTVNYNGTGAQTVIAFNYYNITISGARTSSSITLANSGTIGVAKMFLPLCTFTTGGYVNTGSTINFNGTFPQVISAFPYNDLTSSSTGGRSFASTGTVKIAGTFTPGSNTYTNIGATGEGFTTMPTSSISTINSISAPSTTTCFSASYAGAIQKTTDGGATWASQTSTTTNDLFGISFYDVNNGVAVGNTGTIVLTADGGTTWATKSSGTTEHFRCVAYASSSNVFAGAANGVIRKSTNGGTTWGATTTPGGVLTIYSMTFTSANVGYAVGWAGAIIKTINGGDNWTSLSSGVTDQLTNVFFTSATTGFVTGTNGRILKTTDAGATWTSITSGTTDYLGGISFSNLNNGYIVGGNLTNLTGTILKTTNGGNTWSLVNPGTSYYSKISIVNSSVGFFAAADGTITKSTCCTGGNTVEFNGTGAQTIPALNYNNLSISGARTSNNITLASSGTIGVSGSITNSATFSSGSIVNTSSTVDLNGSLPQTIPTFTFNNLNTNNTGKKSVTGNVTVQGTLSLVAGEVAIAGNTFAMSSNTYTALTRTTGYTSTTGSGMLRRPTASINVYKFPIGYRTINDSSDLFMLNLTPGKTAAQQFDAALHSSKTGFVLSYDKTMYGTGTETVLLDVTTSSYNSLHFEFDINTSANISAVRVTDQNDNTLKTLPSAYYTITGGNSLAIPNIYQLCLIYSKAGLNGNLNWTYEISYDGNGLPVSEKIQYSDLLGRPTQTQVRNVADTTVLVSQTVYDNYGQAALQTLPAPIGSVMQYQTNFITNAAGQPYTYTDFDKPSTNNNYIGEINNPSTVSNTAPGTLGWYYSNNNTLEPFQATTSYPYSRKELTAGGRSAAPGDEYRMGAGHESKGFSMVSGDELKFIFGTNKSFKDSIDVSDKMTNYALTISGGIQAGKSIGIDADGKEVVSYNVGGLAIATCYSGITGACTMTTVTNTMVYAGTSSTDIHLPYAGKASNSLKLLLPQYDFGGRQTVSASDITFKITDLSTNKVLTPGTGNDYTVNSSTQAVTFLGGYATGSSVLRISFVFTQAKLDYFAANSITVPDANITYDLDYSRWSINYYDLSGHLRKSVSPLGINCSSPGTITMSTTYDYSSMGQLIASKSPDEGLKEMTYDDEGKPRFTQNEVQHAANKFSYSNYDAQGRAIESGECVSSNYTPTSSVVFFQNYYGAYSAPYSGNTASSGIINNIGNSGMLTTDCSDQNYVLYYPLPSNGSEDIPSAYSYKSSYSARYLMGKICKTKNANAVTWYGYNQAGQTVFTVQQLLDADYTTYNTTVNSQIKTVDYNYNVANGTLSDQTYQKNGTAEKLKHIFTYDAALRLTKVDVSIAGATAVTQAKYFYSKTGALKRKELGDKLQGIDYIYTLNGQLKSINHPSLDESKDPGEDGKTGSLNAAFGKDVFGLTLDYHANDYVRSNTYFNNIGATTNIYNGMISAQRYKTRSVTNSIDNGGDWIDYNGTNAQRIISATTPLNDEIMNQYSYDDEYRLSTVVFGKYDNSTNAFTANANNCYKEYGASSNSGIGYDANGNITSLKRNAYNGTIGLVMDDFTYTYTSNTNKLASIIDAATSTYTTDFDAATSKSFTYNNIGQMTRSQAENISNNDIEYNVRGLIKKVPFNVSGKTAEYWYDDRGQKLKTKYYNGVNSKFTWYISDAAGNPLAIYEYDQAQTPTPTFQLTQELIYGSGRIGTLDKVTGVIDYEITDHLGNVRATIKGISTGVYELTSRTDYYAFGGAMPGRSYNLNTYRFNYQGQEKALGTNWENFDLRMHNSDLGRWFQPDPEGQFYSPYISMGNNPVSGVDPDGGYYQGLQGAEAYTLSWHYGQGLMTDHDFALLKATWTFGGKSFYNDADFVYAYTHRNDGGSSMDAWLDIESDRLGRGIDNGPRPGERSRYLDSGGDAGAWFNGGNGNLDAKTSAGLAYVMSTEYGSTTSYQVNDKKGNIIGNYKDKSEAEFIWAQAKIGIILPEVNVEDVSSQLHDVVQFTLNHLDNFRNSDLSSIPWKDIYNAAFSEKFETNKSLNGQSGAIKEDYTFDKMLIPASLIKTIINLSSITTTKGGGGGSVITIGRLQYVGPRYIKTTADYSRSIKIWEDLGGKKGNGGWEHIWDWNDWTDFLNGGK